LNTLDSRTSLTENAVEALIPSANVRVEERRSEAFITGTWTMSAAWNLELGTRFEYSELAQSGDATSSKSFFFPKPRALLTWSHGANQVHLLMERTVGQLDFEDFVSSASLSTGTVTAGNPDLEPDRTRRVELAWERRVLQSGSIGLAIRHDEIDDLIDRFPVVADSVFDAIGNIGTGTRDELEIDATLPLDSIGIPAAVLKATALWRDSKTTDPVTGQSRMISEEEPFEAELHFLQSLARWNARWGIDLTLPTQEREYHFDEVRTDRLGTTLNIFAEYEPARAWNVRVFVSNLTDRSAVRERQVYNGMRDTAPLRYIETRTLNIGTYAGVQVRRRFGE
jgi:outer membrane receptor protein involved in Fe transport